MAAWEKYIRRVEPYVPGEQPQGSGIIKLNTNENPYPPSPGVAEALAGLDPSDFRLYPDPSSGELVRALSEAYGVAPERIFCGVGSDDVLAMCFLTFFNSGRPIRFPDVSYSFYSVWAELFGVPYERPALDADLRIRPEDYFAAEGGVVFPNPNAPTSLLMGHDAVEEIVRQNPDCVVIVDEAYIDFAADPQSASVVDQTDRYENLLVVQTFSKSRSLAGLRIGFAVGQPRLIRALNDVKYSFNSYTMSRAALTLGAAAARDAGYYRETAAKIRAVRDEVCGRFAGLGFTFPEPSANFVFVKPAERAAADIFRELRERKIYVRYFAQPRIDDRLRVTVGTPEQMDVLFGALKELV